MRPCDHLADDAASLARLVAAAWSESSLAWLFTSVVCWVSHAYSTHGLQVTDHSAGCNKIVATPISVSGVENEAAAQSCHWHMQASLGQPAQVHHLIRNVKESPFSSHISVRATVVGSLLSCGLLDDAAAELTALLRVWQQQHSRAGGQQTASRLSTVSRQHAAQHRQLMQSCHALVHAAERAGDHAVLQSALHHMQEVCPADPLCSGASCMLAF